MDFSWRMRVVTEVGLDLDCGVVDSMGERMEFRIDGLCSELGFGNIPEVSAKDCIPLHSSPILPEPDPSFSSWFHRRG